MHSRRIERLRLLDANCPEMRGATLAAGRAARRFTEEWVAKAFDAETFTFLVATYKSDAFGRYLARVWRYLDEISLNEALLTANHAVLYVPKRRSNEADAL